MASACALTRWVFCVVVFFGWPCLAATEREAWLEVYRAGLGPYSSSEKLERCQSLSVPARFKCLAFTGEHRALTQLYEQALPLASESPTSDEAPFFFSNEPTDVPYRATGFRWAAECAARLLKEAGPGTTDEQRKPWVATGIELLNRLLTSNRPEARVFAAAALSEYAGPLVYASGDKSGVPREGIAAVCRSGPTLATPLLATMAVHSCRKMVSIEEHRELILRTAARWPESSLQFLLWAELPRPTAQLLEPAINVLTLLHPNIERRQPLQQRIADVWSREKLCAALRGERFPPTPALAKAATRALRSAAATSGPSRDCRALALASGATLKELRAETDPFLRSDERRWCHDLTAGVRLCIVSPLPHTARIEWSEAGTTQTVNVAMGDDEMIGWAPSTQALIRQVTLREGQMPSFSSVAGVTVPLVEGTPYAFSKVRLVTFGATTHADAKKGKALDTVLRAPIHESKACSGCNTAEMLSHDTLHVPAWSNSWTLVYDREAQGAPPPQLWTWDEKTQRLVEPTKPPAW